SDLGVKCEESAHVMQYSQVRLVLCVWAFCFKLPVFTQGQVPETWVQCMRGSRPILSYGLLTYTGRVPRIHRVSRVFPYGPPGVYERHVYRMCMRGSRPILSYGLLTYTGRVPRIHWVSRVFPYGPSGAWECHGQYRPMVYGLALAVSLVYTGYPAFSLMGPPAYARDTAKTSSIDMRWPRLSYTPGVPRLPLWATGCIRGPRPIRPPCSTRWPNAEPRKLWGFFAGPPGNREARGRSPKSRGGGPLAPGRPGGAGAAPNARDPGAPGHTRIARGPRFPKYLKGTGSSILTSHTLKSTCKER
ncbi:hypothetical protein XENOCAPTIV_021478, partial [Xenoophorus captivus]